ncbi:Plasmid stabilization system protein [Bremerella volcania]|uniref:Plasmid stabilization system protein n=1 Tax=Bremerella volcania TaxID=2527984 RepID=A0A518C7Y8_9BACT|nr:Plasmid stabilization system protein [Bremerella volcania]
MIIDVHPEALLELQEAAKYYESKSTNLGVEFLDEFEACTRRIKESPTRFALVNAKTRCCSMFRFPFGIYYRLSENHARIILIRHRSRDPKYGMDRT